MWKRLATRKGYVEKSLTGNFSFQYGQNLWVDLDSHKFAAGYYRQIEISAEGAEKVFTTIFYSPHMILPKGVDLESYADYCWSLLGGCWNTPVPSWISDQMGDDPFYHWVE